MFLDEILCPCHLCLLLSNATKLRLFMWSHPTSGTNFCINWIHAKVFFQLKKRNPKIQCLHNIEACFSFTFHLTVQRQAGRFCYQYVTFISGTLELAVLALSSPSQQELSFKSNGMDIYTLPNVK